MALNKIKEWQLDLSGINAKIEAIGKPVNFKGRVDSVDQLPEVGADGDLYYVGPIGSENKKEYIWYDGAFELLGNTSREDYDSLHNDLDELGDQVAEIESKIPESTSGTNPLINKQQLLDAIQGGGGGGGGSAEIPDNVYTEDNLVGGENISFAKESSYDANTISLYHFEGNSNDEITGGKMLNDSALSGAESKFGTGSLGLIEDTISVGALSKTINPKTTSFTMEFWHKFVAGTTSGRYGEETSIAFMPTEQTDPGWKTNWIGMHMLPDGNYNTIKIQIGESRLGDFSTASLTTVGSWNHYAFVWDVTTTTFKIYMNGKLGGTYEYGSTDWLETFGYIGAFKYTTGSESLTTARMYIDELRVSDTIRYTGEFEVATKAFEGSEAKTKVNAVLPEGLYTQDSLIAGKNVTFTEVPPEGGIDEHTLALWSYDSDRIDKINGITGNTQDSIIDSTQAKFGTGCLKTLERDAYWTSSSYDSSGRFYDISSLNLTTKKQITVDFWIRLNGPSTASYSSPNYEYMAFNRSSDKFGISWLWDCKNKTIVFADLQNGSNVSKTISIESVGEWHHVAYVYDGLEDDKRTSVIYFDGVKVLSNALPNATSSSLTRFNFWRRQANGNPENCIDEARISDIVRYDEDFTPPTEPYTLAEGPSKTAVNAVIPEVDIPEGIYTQTNLLGGKDIEIVPELVDGGIDEYTLACWHFDDADGTKERESLDEVSAMAYPYSTQGTSSVRIAAFKFGAAGLLSRYQVSKDFSLASEDEWTIDCWWKPLSAGAVFVAGIGEIITSYQRPRYYHVTFDSSSTRNKIYVSPNHTSSYDGNVKEVDANFVANQYYHVAAQKNKNGVISAYVDGVKVIEYEGDIRNESPYLGWGSQYGHIDELRISKVARYTDDFEPPTEPYSKAEPTGNMVVNYVGEKLQKGADYVVESYNDGTNWYRVYKSGWIEQGGIVGQGNERELILTFPKSFADTNYTITKTNNWYLDVAASFKWINFWGKTTTTATTHNSSQSTGGVGFSWYACGQGA